PPGSGSRIKGRCLPEDSLERPLVHPSRLHIHPRLDLFETTEEAARLQFDAVRCRESLREIHEPGTSLACESSRTRILLAVHHAAAPCAGIARAHEPQADPTVVRPVANDSNEETRLRQPR